MCGIAGVVHTESRHPLDTAWLDHAEQSLRHRGPNDSGQWHGPGAGFAHTRLSILDLSPAGRQPFAYRRHQLVYNGELYNHAELRRELESLGHKFHTTCDTEVVAAALAEWDADALTRFNGMFALAWYDTESRRLLLARDRLGIKPLFYRATDDGISFASELTALPPGEVCRNALRTYLTYLYIPAPDTIYTNTHKLQPGHYAEWREGQLSTHRYWSLEYTRDFEGTHDDAAAQLRALLEDSVRLRRVADVPLGAFLSGGVDSSGVVAALARQSDTPIKTFSIGFEEPEANELPYARIAAEHCGTEHHEEICTPDLAALLPDIARHLGEPFADSSALPMWLVSRLASEHVTVVLSGDGGDELFAGYTWLHRALDVARYRDIPQPLRIAFGAFLPESRWRRFHTDAYLSEDDAFLRRLQSQGTSYLDALMGESPDIDRVRDTMAAHGALPYPERMLATDTHVYLPDDILTKVDRMTMAHGLEARVPLLDHRLVEFAATLPFEYKHAERQSKRVLKAALQPWLPESLFTQRKRGFSLPIHAWFRGPLREVFHDTALSTNSRTASLVDTSVIASMHEAHQSGREDLGHALWSLLMLELWLQT